MLIPFHFVKRRGMNIAGQISVENDIDPVILLQAYFYPHIQISKRIFSWISGPSLYTFLTFQGPYSQRKLTPSPPPDTYSSTWLVVGLMARSPFRVRILSGFNFPMSCVYCHSCCEFKGAPTCCVQKALSLQSFTASMFFTLSTLSSAMIPEPWGGACLVQMFIQ